MKILKVDGQFAYVQAQEPEEDFRVVNGVPGKLYGYKREWQINHFVFLREHPRRYDHTYNEWIEFESQFTKEYRYDMLSENFYGCTTLNQ